jgi:cell division protein FtsL
MGRTEEASGRFKTLFSLAFLAAIIYVGIKTVPAYVNNYQLQDHIRQLSIQLAVRTTPPTPDEVRNEVVAFAQDHGIPLTADNVKVTISHRISISLDYTVPVDLMVYTLRLHFTPSAENQSL